MTRRLVRQRRCGAFAAESAVVLPTLLFLIFAIVVGGFGVFRYQQIAMLAREGARYASVHGGQYQAETGKPAATPQDVYNNAIVPLATNLDLSQMSYSVNWSNNSNMPYCVDVNHDYETPTRNTVTVTIWYNWFPEVFLVGPIVMSSSSTVPMYY